ncbi:phytoene desaturase family protein [Halonatronum saccharophilum]|uniref:phytoene desaturase family protein n=1 Tax=Halonatronum saccharophilum TaxID=150060 RepID=UPI000488C58C|nr:NAD(P)/FAD-dependent oxidoreductase [Halonatronum saccharophilum]
MKKKKVLIIGAGIAGLSAGSYLERNGYDTEIFEDHSIPGGLCTAWKRGEYTFDYCVHWLMGTKEGTGFDVIWDELGALENEKGVKTPIRNFEEFSRIELSGGDVVGLYSNLDRLEEEFLRVAPEDEKKISKFIKDLKKLAKFKTPVATEKWGIKDRIKFIFSNFIPFLKVIKYARITMEELSDQWDNPKLKEVFRTIFPPSWSSLAFIFGMAFQHIEAAGYPVGGSLPLAKNIEREYLKLGGKIYYSSKVEEILVEDDKAVGIRLEGGEEYFGDDIVSAADGYTTLYKMLDGRYLSSQLKKAYEDFSLFPSSIYLGFGVEKDLSDMPHATLLHLDPPLLLSDGSKHEYISLNVYNFDPTLAPEGKTTVTVLINTWKDQYWQELAEKDYGEYKTIKADLSDKVLNIIDEKFPGFSSTVEKVDVSTPHTVKRYTGNWQGSYEGFAPTPVALMKKLPKEVPELNSCYMIGQWTEPGGGIPSAALDGRNLARRLCKRDKKEFISSRKMINKRS